MTMDAALHPLLPANLLELPLVRLRLDAETVGICATNGVLSVGDALALPVDAFGEAAPFAGQLEPLRQAIERALHDGLLQFAAVDAADWPTLRAQLCGPLDDDDRTWLLDHLGLVAEGRTEPVRRLAAGERAERVRSRLIERAPSLLLRLHLELKHGLAAGDGVLALDAAEPGSLLQALAAAGHPPRVGIRLFALLFPLQLHLHRETLLGIASKRYRAVARRLPALVAPQRLPLPVDTLAAELAADGDSVPRGVLLHLLKAEARITIAADAQQGEVAVPDPRSPGIRLVELLREAQQPMALTDLVFAYRERFRAASAKKLERHLRRSNAFLQIGHGAWALRRWHERELAAVAPLADKVARRLAAEGGRQHVAAVLGRDLHDDRTLYLVLDQLAHDDRVRLLGRGDACATSHKRSRVLEQLLLAFRRAAGDVVVSLYLQNQPEHQRRLVSRLLRQNRLFVMPAPDRADTLSNYPLNPERMRRLIALVHSQLKQRSGHANATALKASIDQTDLGGEWLVPDLLVDVLRRHGPFEILPGGIVALKTLDLTRTVRRTLRQALRESGIAVTIDEVLRARPDLAEFTPCLAALLGTDPLVQTPDGVHFMLV
jgi:hypothetical protein